MSRTVIPSLAVGWLGSVASWLTAAHPILSLLSTVLAAVASIHAIVVARRTARLRRIQIEEATRVLRERLRANHATNDNKP